MTAATTRIKIISRYNSARVLFECDAPEGMDSSLHMRYALEKATNERVDLSGATLTGANLSDASLTDASVRGADLTGADLRNATLTGANLADTDLVNANLSGASMRYAYLRDADLTGADLTGANLREADLSGANLSGGAKLRGANLSRAILCGADLAGADLRDTYLRDAALRNADLTRADLRDANLAGAELRYTDLTGADLTGADLRGATLSETIGQVTSAPAPDVPIMVTREMIEAHYKSIMNAARILLSQGETIHAQDLLSEACSRPYPTPAPAAADRNEDYFHNWTPHIAARAPAPMPEAAAAEPVIRAWIKETPSGVYLRDARAMAMADIPEDGPTRFGWEPLYAGGTP